MQNSNTNLEVACPQAIELYVTNVNGHNLNVMRQSACLVFSPIMVDNYASLLKTETVKSKLAIR